MIIPKIGEKLNQEHLSYLNAFSKSCRHTIISMLKNSQSGHPGGSLSAIDYLSLIYSFIVSQSGEKVVVSNGHISPAVYSVLAELGYISKDELVRDFRKIGSIYEGHITRHVKGIEFGTGPLGIGVSVGSAFALSSQIKQIDNKVFTLMGDGEAQEGQVYEMMNFASANKLNNLILFIDYNRVQLTDSLEKMIPLDLKAIFEGCNWKVIEVNGHDFQAMWHVIGEAYKVSDQPVMILGKTIMGKGVEMMELDGQKLIPTWHGKTANPEESDLILKALELNSKELEILEEKNISWIPEETCFVESLKQLEIDTGRPIIYGTDKLTDCRTAYGMALLDLAEKNPEILAISADLRGSVMTKFVAENLPDQHIECGIAEQHMVSLAGGFSLDGFIPFCSTFGAFLSSRAKGSSSS
jgi:transketolase